MKLKHIKTIKGSAHTNDDFNGKCELSFDKILVITELPSLVY